MLSAQLHTPPLVSLLSVVKARWRFVDIVIAKWVFYCGPPVLLRVLTGFTVFKMPEVKFLVVGTAASELAEGQCPNYKLMGPVSSRAALPLKRKVCGNSLRLFGQKLNLIRPRRSSVSSPVRTCLDVAAASTIARATVGFGEPISINNLSSQSHSNISKIQLLFQGFPL